MPYIMYGSPGVASLPTVACVFCNYGITGRRRIVVRKPVAPGPWVSCEQSRHACPAAGSAARAGGGAPQVRCPYRAAAARRWRAAWPPSPSARRRQGPGRSRQRRCGARCRGSPASNGSQVTAWLPDCLLGTGAFFFLGRGSNVARAVQSTRDLPDARSMPPR